MSKNKEEYADQIIREMTQLANGGFDPKTSAEAVDAALKALRDMAVLIRDQMAKMVLEKKEVDPVALSKALANITRMIDDVTRLTAFTQGGADSRPDIGSSMLASLTDAQLEVVNGWIRENEKVKG